MAKMFNVEKKIGCVLHVIRMQDWQRGDWFDQTGLPWVNPSPNLRSVDAGIPYPGLEILQAGGISVGRGTDKPFGRLGAPWIRREEFSDEMNRRTIPGVRFVPDEFTPDSGPYKGELCQGARVEVTDRAALQAMRMGMEIAAALGKLYPDKFELAKMIVLVGNGATIERLTAGNAPAKIVAGWEKDLAAFRKMRMKYLLYQ